LSVIKEPPLVALITLKGPKLKIPISPNVPVYWPFTFAPKDWAASSIT